MNLFALYIRSLLAVIVWGVMATSAVGQEPVLRAIPDVVGQTFCRGDFAFRVMWSVGFYEAQVEGLMIRGIMGHIVPKDVAIERAKALAVSRGNGSYAVGSCSDGSSWAVTLPSSIPMSWDGRVLQIKPSSHCDRKGAQVFWVDEQGGRSSLIKGSAGRYTMPNGKSGYVSVVCESKSRGPRELFLAPVGKPRPVLPESSLLLVKGQDDMTKALSWINTVRRQARLFEVRFSDAVANSAAVLAESQAVAHDVAQLNVEEKKLKRLGFSLIGENRSRARTLEEALTLLWISPLHRDLILNAKATDAGIVVRFDKDIFVDVVFAIRLAKQKNSKN